jgi:hypothetical protein
VEESITAEQSVVVEQSMTVEQSKAVNNQKNGIGDGRWCEMDIMM